MVAIKARYHAVVVTLKAISKKTALIAVARVESDNSKKAPFIANGAFLTFTLQVRVIT